MGVEVELKLNASARALRELEALPWLRRLAARDGERRTLVSVYFDTANAKLARHGVTLRVRRDGAKRSGERIQTIKAGAAAAGAGAARAAGPFARPEWEAPIPSDRPVLALAAHTALAPLLGPKSARKLQPVFETHIRRTIIPVRLARSDIELAIDRGTIRAGGRTERVSEVELELKRGDPHGIVLLAQRITKRCALRYGPLTKAERGYALAHRIANRATGATTPTLDKRSSAADAFQVIGFSCLRHLALNEDLVREGNPQAIHQMRVGLRRLQAAIACFQEMLADPESEHIRAESKWLRGALGPARDLEVLIQESIAPLQAAQPQRRELAALRARIEVQRRRGLRLARSAVQSERYRRFVLATALWLAGGGWRTRRGTAPLRARRIVGLARRILDHRTARLRRKFRRVDMLSADQRHKLRIAAKQLRYATEFFSSLFTARQRQARRKQFSAILKSLQDDLGKLNDISVHGRIAQAEAARQASFALGLVAGREQTDVEPLLRAAKKAGSRLKKAPRFWR